MKNTLPTIALVGRTNVGKSTLFNRLLEEQKAMVSGIAGTTRDWKEGNCLWQGRHVRVIDTGGLDVDASDKIDADTIKQTHRAIDQSDIVLFLVDLQNDPLPQEQTLAKELRDSGKEIIVVGNKAESAAQRASAHEKQWRLGGLPAPFPISAFRGTGVGDLLDLIYEKLEAFGKPPQEPLEIEAIKVAVIGKPNVGKSSLLNAILGEERFITSPVSHTTREPNDTLVEVDDKKYLLIDTAGMRKKGKVKKTGGLESRGVSRTEMAVRQADVVLFVTDAAEPMGNQERVLAGMLKETDAGVIFVMNKWDLVEDKETNTINQYKKYITKSIPFLRWAPMLFVSAKEKQRVRNVFKLIDQVQENRNKEFTDEELDAFLQDTMRRRSPIRGKGAKPPKVLALQQLGTKPPRFSIVIKAARANQLSVTWVRFLENRMRATFNLEGTPVRIRVITAKSVAK
jgi:GTP-binding protein